MSVGPLHIGWTMHLTLNVNGHESLRREATNL